MNLGIHAGSHLKESYLRNERNMERIDNTIKLISENSTQMNKLLEMFAHQNERIQDRADKVIDILSNKM